MSLADIAIYSLNFYIPSICSLIFRALGLGYRSRSRIFLGFAAFTIYSLVVPSLLIARMGYGEYTHIASLVMLIGGLAVLIFSTDKPSKTICLHLLQGNMVAAVSTPLNMIRHLLGLTYDSLLLLTLIACPLVCILALRFWAKPLRFLADHIQGGMASILALPIISQITIMILPTYPARNFEFHPVYCTIMMLVVELSLFLYVYNLYRNLLQISVLAKQELQRELLQSELVSYEEYLQTARQSRHDLRYHNLVILEYLMDHEIEHAKEYLNRQEKDLSETVLTTYCENLTANAVLRLYERKTRSLGISYGVQADLPAKLRLTDTEIGGMLSNLLENACESCERISLPDTYILFVAERDEYNLKIEVSNSVNGESIFDLQGLPITRKLGGGTGTRSIKTVVKSYGGMLRFTRQDDVFVTQIILPLTSS